MVVGTITDPVSSTDTILIGRSNTKGIPRSQTWRVTNENSIADVELTETLTCWAKELFSKRQKKNFLRVREVREGGFEPASPRPLKEKNKKRKKEEKRGKKREKEGKRGKKGKKEEKRGKKREKEEKRGKKRKKEEKRGKKRKKEKKRGRGDTCPSEPHVHVNKFETSVVLVVKLCVAPAVVSHRV